MKDIDRVGLDIAELGQDLGRVRPEFVVFCVKFPTFIDGEIHLT